MSEPAPKPREVRVMLPPEVAEKYGDADDEVARELRELAVVDLVRTAKISSGFGAKMLGLPKIEFLKVMSRHQVSPFDDTEEGLAAERATLEKLAQKRS